VNKKIICHINTTFNSRSGSAKRTLKVLKACQDNGYEVLLITGNNNDVDLEQLQGVTVEIVPQLIKAISLKNEFKAYKKIQSLIEQYGPSIVHTHLAKAGILGRLAARNKNIHIVHTVHGPTFPKTIHPIKRLVFWVTEMITASVTDTFIFVGEELRQSFIDAKVCNSENSFVINTARDDSQISYESLGCDEKIHLQNGITSDKTVDKKLISCVARLVPGKQQDHAIQVLYKLHQKGFTNTHLVLIGKALVESEIQFEYHLKELVHTLKLDNFVHFLGHRNDVLEIMDVSDVVILPSKYEGLPNVVVEAVLSGTPVVSYNVSGVDEILGKLFGKLVVPQGDIKGMTNVIVSLFESSDDLFEEYAKLKEVIRKRFSNKVMLERKMKFYEEFVKGSSNVK